MNRTLRRILVLLIAAVVVASIVYAFQPQPVGVDLARVTRGPLQVTIDEDGKTRIKERYIVSAPLAGRLLRIDMDPGDAVVSGISLLATIEPSDPELLDARALAEAEARVKATEASLQRTAPALEQARAALEFAETELARVLRLDEKRAISRQEVDDARLAFRLRTEEFRAASFAQDIARYELQQAQAALTRTRPATDENPHANWQFEIRSPIDGRVLRVLQESAAVVSAGTPLLEVGDPADLEIEIDVLSTDAVRVTPGAKVWIEHWGGDRPLVGTVRLVEPSAFTKISALGVEEQRVNVIADFVDPPAERPTLGDGFRVEARIVTWENESVLRVPSSALFREGTQWAVFVVDGGRAALRKVKLGRRNNLESEVLDGLSQDEQVVVHPSDRIRNGVAVRPRDADHE